MTRRMFMALVGIVTACSLGGGALLAQTTERDAPFALAPPPRIVLRAASGEQAGGEGTFCWENGCADYIGVEIPAQPLVLARDETVDLDVSAFGRASEGSYWIYPYEAVAEQDGRRWILYGEANPLRMDDLGKGKKIPLALDLPSGHYALEVFVSLRGGGDSTQGFNLVVEPGTAERGVEAVATPAATPQAATAGIATPLP